MPVSSGDYTSTDPYAGSDWWTPSWQMATDPTDTSVYSPIDTTIGPMWKEGGLATPLYAKGGGVKHMADGGSFIDQVAASAPSASLDTTATPMTTSTSATDTTGQTNQSGLLSLIGNILSNKGVSGALLGAALTQLMGSSTQPVNKGVNMSALGSLQPKTTTFGMGPAKYVPYSEYGTPTGQQDYSTLFRNLGVSPFGAGTASPSALLSPAVSAPTFNQQYFEDGSGNIYDQNGDLVYDVTSGSKMGSSGTVSSPIASTPINPFYTFGTDINPADVIGSKDGGLTKMANGGMPQNANLHIPMMTSNVEASNVPTVGGRNDYRQGSYVEGEGDGQSDDIPAMLADGEYVIDAETVAQLGNGSNKAGAKVLDQFRQNIRAHKRGAPHDKIPPKAKSALAYLKGTK